MGFERVLYFVVYFAQGVMRVGKDYLRHEAFRALDGDPWRMQLFYNFLPEFGSLPWTLKPILMLLADQFLARRGKRVVVAVCALLCAIAWVYLASLRADAAAGNVVLFLLVTATISLASGVVDGLIDGRVAEESTNSEVAAACRYACECGGFFGSLVVGTSAWWLSFNERTMLGIAALSWTLIVPCVLIGPRWANGEQTSSFDSALTKVHLRGLASMATGAVALVCSLSFLVCLSPTLDFFLFRQHVLKLSPSQQSLVSVVGSIGWFAGTFVYRHVIAAQVLGQDTLRPCFQLWPLGALFGVILASVDPNSFGVMGLWYAAFEKFAAECFKALTFMPCTVLMQLYATEGSESTSFALMQWSGTMGQVLSRNVEYALMVVFDVSPKLGAEGFRGFAALTVAAAVWRVVTAWLVSMVIVPRLSGAATGQRPQEKTA